jgi:hypothetical protein
MRFAVGTALVLVLTAAVPPCPPHAGAASQQILGKKLLVRNPTGAEQRRTLVALGRESATDVPAIVGDPTVSGALLRVTLNGATSTGGAFLLDAAGWSASNAGFTYSGPTGPDGDPVRRVVLKRTPAGTALLKVVIRGSVGTQPVDLVPPNPGTDAAVTLAINGGGDTYCVSLGGAAGGTSGPDTASVWRIRDALAQPGCPLACCALGGVCAWGGPNEECAIAGGTLGAPGSVCDGATGGCIAPSAAPGPCCDDLSIPGSPCFGGPTVNPIVCNEAGGTFSASAVCDPGLGCASP